MANVTGGADRLPFASLALQKFADFGVQGFAHAPSVAKLCGSCKQHFAHTKGDTPGVAVRSINVVVAEALAFYMGERWNNSTLGRAAGVAPNTIRNCLEPGNREPSKSGKEPSVKIAELAKIADALGGVELADMITDMTPAERTKLLRKRAASFFAQYGRIPGWAPAGMRFPPDFQDVGGLTDAARNLAAAFDAKVPHSLREVTAGQIMGAILLAEQAARTLQTTPDPIELPRLDQKRLPGARR